MIGNKNMKTRHSDLYISRHIFMPGASISNITFRGMHIKYGGAVVEAENKWNKEQMVEKEQLVEKNSWWKRIAGGKE